MTFNDSLDVKKWIRYAQNDYDFALLVSERFRPPIEIVCYHCQQTAEKIFLDIFSVTSNARRQRVNNNAILDTRRILG